MLCKIVPKNVISTTIKKIYFNLMNEEKMFHLIIFVIYICSVPIIYIELKKLYVNYIVLIKKILITYMKNRLYILFSTPKPCPCIINLLMNIVYNSTTVVDLINFFEES